MIHGVVRSRRIRRQRASLLRVFAVPAVLFAASLAGLVAGLAGDGWADALAWALLSVPLLAGVRAFARRA